MMARLPKFAVLELDGVELGLPSEYDAVSEDIYYDAGKTETVKDRIDRFALGYGDFFKWSLNQDLKIPEGRSKVVTGKIIINSFKLEIGLGAKLEIT